LHLQERFRLSQRRARKIYQDTYRVTKPVPVEVEITENGLSFRQFGITTIYDWNTVRIAEETDDAIYFRVPPGHLSAVRKRAFDSDAQKDEFLEMVNQYWSEAVVPRPPSFENSNRSQTY
jgi:hypothetical protein